MIVRQIGHLAVAELRLIWRNRGLAVLVLGLPLAIAASLAIGTGAGDWGELAGAQLLLMLLLGVYTTATTTVVARRQQLVLKRLRSGELSDAVLIAGVLAPVLVIGAGQMALALVATVAAGTPAPSSPLLLVPAVALGAVMCAALALATTHWTPSAELAQLTTTPLLIAAMASSVWVGNADDPATLWVLAPGVAFADLIHEAATGAGAFGVLPALGAMTLWTAAGIALARRGFRWEPRS
jgi:ABC-2 type transport system permease protein